MRIVENPNSLPSGAVNEGTPFARAVECAVLPRTTDDEGFIATGKVGPDDRETYISIAAVREMGRLIGLVDASQYDEILAEQERITDELKEQVAEAVELEKARTLVAAADKE